MLRKKLSVLISVLFAVSLCIPCITYAKSPVYLVAASDFQARVSEVPSENDVQSAKYMSDIFDKMESVGGYSSFDGLLFCGDYNQSTTTADASSGLAAIDGLMTSRYPSCTDRFYVQGNHDPAATVGLSPSGANDTADYGVYIIHEDEYPHNANGSLSKSATTATAASLKAYLKDKIDAGYKKPIFIITHLPLHYNSRSVEKNNAVYGNLLYDVIDEAAECGLNIVYLFGHNHSGYYDYYLGNQAIYLESGDDIIVAQGSTTVTRKEKLHFTYLNAGYVGYTASRKVSELTMTVFKIENDMLTVERYNNQGRYALKAAGTNTATVGDKTPVNTKTYESPRTVSLNTTPAEWGVEWTEISDSGCVSEQSGQSGIARFIFEAEPARGRIKQSGIVYLNADGSEAARSQTGNKSIFYSEIINIPMYDEKTYHAKAYCTVESALYDGVEYTFWSDIAECNVDYSNFVTAN